jgi:hypothetical protein
VSSPPEPTDLRLIDFIDDIAVAQGQVAPADTLRRFEDQAVVALATQFVCSGEPGNAGAEDEHPSPPRSQSRDIRQRFGRARRCQTQAYGSLIGRGRPRRETDQIQQASSGKRGGQAQFPFRFGIR